MKFFFKFFLPFLLLELLYIKLDLIGTYRYILFQFEFYFADNKLVITTYVSTSYFLCLELKFCIYYLLVCDLFGCWFYYQVMSRCFCVYPCVEILILLSPCRFCCRNRSVFVHSHFFSKTLFSHCSLQVFVVLPYFGI